MNYKTRYGTNTYDHKGNVVELGDLDKLTPRQRKRVRRKEAREGGPKRPQRRRLQRRRVEGPDKRGLLFAALTRPYRSSTRTVGGGTQRAQAREQAYRESIEKRHGVDKKGQSKRQRQAARKRV